MVAYVASGITAMVNYDATHYTLSLIAVLFLVALDCMTIAFLLARLLNRTDLIDAAWPLTILMVAVTSLSLGDSKVFSVFDVQRVGLILVALWALRLAIHIARRLLSRPEDARYVALRKGWKGNEALSTYFRIFFVQAVLATLISASIIALNASPSASIGTWTVIGAILWFIGFGFEAVGDWQLQRHLKSHPGKLMTSGVWKYTRHPNYFGEAMQWWGIFLIALESQFGLAGILSPLIITYLLLFVSGIPMMEKSFQDKIGWAGYKKRTSPFLPLPPKKV